MRLLLLICTLAAVVVACTAGGARLWQTGRATSDTAASLKPTGARKVLATPSSQSASALRLPCAMTGPGVAAVGDPPDGWTPCGTSPSGWITLYVPSATDCVAPLTVAAGTPIVFVDRRAAAFDMDADGDVDLADYAEATNAQTQQALFDR